MAELIWTDDEKAATSLVGEWSDAAIANAVKFSATVFKDEMENKAVLSQTCAQILAAFAVETNAETLTVKLDGVTLRDKELGDWVVTVKRKA